MTESMTTPVSTQQGHLDGTPRQAGWRTLAMTLALSTVLRPAPDAAASVPAQA